MNLTAEKIMNLIAEKIMKFIAQLYELEYHEHKGLHL